MLEFGFKIPDHYYSSLMLNIFSIFSLNTTSDDFKMNTLFQTGEIEIKIAESILKKLNMTYDHILLKEIANAFTGIINHNKNYSMEYNNLVSNEFIDTVKSILQKTFVHFHLDINFEKYYFLFINHVQLMVKRAKTKNWFTGDSFSVKNSNIFVYDVALFFCNEISTIFDIEITEEEISLVAIHLGYVIEESFSNEQSISIGLVTEEHKTIYNYIMNKISNNYDFEIKFTKIDNMTHMMTTDYDLIISIKDFKNLHLCPHCLITPFLTDSDKNKIQKSILEVLDHRSKKLFKSVIGKYFDKSLFFYDEKLTNKYEVLEFMINKLQEKNIVDENFFGQILKRERLSPTSFMNKFAIPHPFSCTALSSKIAVYINPNSIKWSDDSTVQCVFLIAISSDEQAMLRKFFDGLALFLSDEKKLTQLNKITSYDQLLDIIFDF